MTDPHRAAVLGLLALLSGPLALGAQWQADVAARATGVLIRADPAPYGAPLTELRLTQPVLMLRVRAGHALTLRTTLNLEGVTLPDGELSAGAYGEGFVDRRHPHTFVHELMLETRHRIGAANRGGEVGLAIGKGFAPFGTDDPMNRPFGTYPVNHHLAQILERAVLIGQVAVGPVVLEAGLFDGDEPESPWQWPLLHQSSGWRFGDSWSARLTVMPVPNLDIQLSTAKVHSPEQRQGAGGDQKKFSGSLRWTRQSPDGNHRLYTLLEDARTSELEEAFVYRSLLGEIALDLGNSRVAYRFERTDRPEEERPTDPYRTRRPHLDNAILGRFVWSLHTIRIDHRLVVSRSGLRVVPFLEGAFGTIASKDGGAVTPLDIYGSDRVKHLRVGLTIDWRASGHRMGRYGVLDSHMEGMMH